MPGLFQRLASAARSGCSGRAGEVKRNNTCRRSTMVAGSLPIWRLARSVTMEMPPGTRIGLLTAPNRHLAAAPAARRGRAGWAAPSRGRRLAGRSGLWLNSAAITANGAPARNCWITVSAKRRASSAWRGIADRHEDLAHPVFGLAGLRLDQGRSCSVDVGVRDLGAAAQHLAQHPAPADLHADLVIPACATPRPRTPAARAGAPGGRPLQLFDVGDRLGDFLVGDDDLAPLDFLEAQPLVDQLAGDLRGQPVQHVLGHRQAGGQREQPRGGYPHRRR